MSGRGFPVAVQVRILGDVEFFGVHKFDPLPRVGEVVELTRHDTDHTLTVREVRHKLGGLGHGITLICD